MTKKKEKCVHCGHTESAHKNRTGTLGVALKPKKLGYRQSLDECHTFQTKDGFKWASRAKLQNYRLQKLLRGDLR
jgi:hypothetical protein